MKNKKLSENAENPNSIADFPCAENQCHEATVFCATCEVDLCEKCVAEFRIQNSEFWRFRTHTILKFEDSDLLKILNLLI